MANSIYKVFSKTARAHGGAFVRMGQGSHAIWRGPNGRKASVPKTLKKRGTANAILKQLGIDAKV